MQRFLDWLDEAAGGLIRLTYLASGISAIAVYFGAGALPSAVVGPLNAALPWLLGFSLETHTYLTARRVRAAWQDWERAAPRSVDRLRAWGVLRVHLTVLAGLMLFSMWNQLNYVAQSWHPPVTALAIPGPLAYVIRATVVPCAFIAAAFLAPVAESLHTDVQRAAHQLARATFRVARRQWKERLQQMRREGRDVSTALVQLIEDPEERRIIETIYRAIQGERPPDQLQADSEPVNTPDLALAMPHVTGDRRDDPSAFPPDPPVSAQPAPVTAFTPVDIAIPPTPPADPVSADTRADIDGFATLPDDGQTGWSETRGKAESDTRDARRGRSARGSTKNDAGTDGRTSFRHQEVAQSSDVT